MRLFLTSLVFVLFVFACREEAKKEGKNFTSTFNKDVQTDVNPKKHRNVDHCVYCDSIYNAFPKDSIEFERLYGYPEGLRQVDAYMDVDTYFKCLDSCYDYQKILKMVELEAEIKFDADGPAYVQYNTTDYLMRNPQVAEQIYNEITCAFFEKHIQFSFEMISRYDSFYPKLCDFLQKLKVEDECKQSVLYDYCVRKSVETHKH